MKKTKILALVSIVFIGVFCTALPVSAIPDFDSSLINPNASTSGPSSGSGSSSSATPSSSSSDLDFANSRSLLGLRPWYYGLTDADGNILQKELKSYVAQIALNIVNDAMIVAGLLVTGFIIYGGYLYMFSEGDAGKVVKGKNTIKMATIGAIIVVSANVIFNTISVILLPHGKSTETVLFGGIEVELTTAQSTDMINGMINWAISLGGLVAVAFIVYGGVCYMTAAGDAGKLAKAKSAIKYALIGLLIVGLASAITNFVFNAIIEAQKVS